jgi:hypothetical protein
VLQFLAGHVGVGGVIPSTTSNKPISASDSTGKLQRFRNICPSDQAEQGTSEAGRASRAPRRLGDPSTPFHSARDDRWGLWGGIGESSPGRIMRLMGNSHPTPRMSSRAESRDLASVSGRGDDLMDARETVASPILTISLQKMPDRCSNVAQASCLWSGSNTGGTPVPLYLPPRDRQDWGVASFNFRMASLSKRGHQHSKPNIDDHHGAWSHGGGAWVSDSCPPRLTKPSVRPMILRCSKRPQYAAGFGTLVSPWQARSFASR